MPQGLEASSLSDRALWRFARLAETQALAELPEEERKEPHFRAPSNLQASDHWQVAMASDLPCGSPILSGDAQSLSLGGLGLSRRHRGQLLERLAMRWGDGGFRRLIQFRKGEPPQRPVLQPPPFPQILASMIT